MKPATLLRLYPRAWRERYAEEFLAMLGGRRLTTRDSLDIAQSGVSEWSRRPLAGPALVATCAAVTAEVFGHLLRRFAVFPPGLVTPFSVVLVVIGIGYLLWRLNEWLFERSPHAGRRHVQVGLALSLIAGVISVWTGSAHRPIAALVVLTNPAFFWASIIWSAHVRPPQPPLDLR